MDGAAKGDPAFTGRYVERGDGDYEQSRVGRVFNERREDRYPAAVLEAATVDDVAAGIRLAAQRGWRVSVRSGGHSWAAWSVRQDALLIDLAALRSIAYDEVTGIVVAGPATKGGLELAPFLAERGRAFPGGHCPSVGIGGYLLQGGQGWNSRSRGWACESVVGVDVVTADGEVLHATSGANADLYWAARGAGPGFPGVVVGFHLQTYAAPRVMWHDTWTFALAEGAKLLHWMHELLPTLDQRVEPVIAATRLPNVPLHPGVDHPGGTTLLVHKTVMGDTDDECARLLHPFEGGPLTGRELGHVRGRTTVLQENVVQAEQNPEHHRYAVDCTWTDATAADLAPPLTRLWSELETEHSFSIWYGWAPTRRLPDMAFSIEGNVYVATYVIYTDAADDERYRSWVHGRTGAIAAQGGVGVYLGDTDFGRRNDRFLSDDHFDRLERIRAVRDPQHRVETYLTGDPDGLNAHA